MTNTISKNDFESLFEKEREEYRGRAGDESTKQLVKAEKAVSPAALLWHALVPAWTTVLAKASGFPTKNADRVFRTMVKAGYSLLSEPDILDKIEPVSPDPIFSMPDARRTEVLQKAVTDKDIGPSGLRTIATDIGTQILKAESTVPVPGDTERWAQLVTFIGNLPGLVDWFDALTNELLSKGDSGDLLRWIESARNLESFFGPELGFIIARAVRRLELFRRRADDQRRLSKFLERTEQIAAFKNLLENDKEWALHFIGAGGVGKTMLIRYLTSNLSTQLDVCVARVDFDYLNPDYPARSPGLLLAYLAEEFRVYATDSSVANLLVDLNRSIRNLHDRLQVTTVLPPLDSILQQVFQDLLPKFAEALRHLSRPVIILDTCEELLKIRRDGTVPLSVEATFRMLEELRNERGFSYVPDLRVVFGGRRPLASSGAGWRTVEPSSLPARPYLRVHEIRGFTRDEASKYLGEIERLNEVRPDAISPIIQNSLEQVKISQLTQSVGQANVERCSPFDLWLYASWLHEDKDLPLAELKAANSDRYIELRIVRRQTNPQLLSLLPYVGLLGRFDAETLQEVSGFTDQDDFEEIFNELGNLEWTSRQAGGVLEVDRALQPRLLKYFENGNTEGFRAARQRTAACLESKTLTSERRAMDQSLFVVAFRLLKSEPERALTWWEKIEQKFLVEGAADWLVAICRSILGTETEERPLGLASREKEMAAKLLAAVYITYAGATLQERAFGELEEIWSQAMFLLTEQEDKSKPMVLRARAGHLAARLRLHPQNVSWDEIANLWQDLADLKPGDVNLQTAGSMIAVVENVVEFLESEKPGMPLDVDALENWHRIYATSPDYNNLAFFTQVLRGRLLIVANRPADGIDMLSRVVSENQPERASGPINAPQLFWDWLAPSDIESRVKLEFARLAYPTVGAAEVLELIGDRIPPPRTIDSERLGAAILELRAAIALPINAGDEGVARESFYSIQQEPTCNAHRAFPSLFAASALSIAAAGRVDDAISMLQDRSINLEQFGSGQLESVHQADRALLHITRRMRLRDENIGVETSLNSSPDFLDSKLRWAVEAVSNPKRETNFVTEDYRYISLVSLPELVHARFRTSGILDHERAEQLVAWIATDSPGDEASINTSADLACYLDHVELNQIYLRWNLPVPFPQFSLDKVKQSEVWQKTLQSDSFEKLSLLLCQTGLEAKKVIADDGRDKDLIDKIGWRRAANLALGEGEMLALRLPEPAVGILDLAYKLFSLSKDDPGALISRICAALALARAGESVAFEVTLGKIAAKYGRQFAKTIDGLPGWEALEEAATNPTGDVLFKITRQGWRPWILRLIACLVWKNDGFRRGRKTEIFISAIESNYGSDSKMGRVLPAEFEWLRSSVPVKKRSTLNFTSKRDEIQLVVTSEPGSGQALQSMLKVRIEARRGEYKWEVSTEISGLTPYQLASESLSEMPGTLNLLASSKPSIVRFETDYPASAICWEAVAGAILVGSPKAAGRAPQIVRRLANSKTRRVENWKDVFRIVTWTNNHHAVELAQTAWREISVANNFEYQSAGSDMLSGRGGDDFPLILHLVGVPTETSAGVRMNMSTETFYEDTRQISEVPMSFSPSSSRGELLKAETLVGQFPRLAVCILQPPPRETAALRTGSDRQQGAYLRLLAAEIFRLGVPIVITIPALPSPMFVETLQGIANGLRLLKDPELTGVISTDDVTSSLLSAIAKARQVIFDSDIGSPDDLLEYAFDICLYTQWKN